MGAYLTLHKYDNKKDGINQIKNEGSPLLAQNEVRDDIFSGSLAVFQSERVASAGGRKGGLGGIPPALQILGEICSNFFERTPPSPDEALAKSGFASVRRSFSGRSPPRKPRRRA